MVGAVQVAHVAGEVGVAVVHVAQVQERARGLEFLEHFTRKSDGCGVSAIGHRREGNCTGGHLVVQAQRSNDAPLALQRRRQRGSETSGSAVGLEVAQQLGRAPIDDVDGDLLVELLPLLLELSPPLVP